MLRTVGRHAFENCASLTTVIFPDHKLRIGDGIFLGCDALGVLVLSDSVRRIRRKEGKWSVPEIANLVLHSELKLALLFAELTKEETDAERKAVIRTEIRRHIKHLKKRNQLHSTTEIREDINSAVQAIEEQLNPTMEEEISKNTEQSPDGE